MQTYTPLSTKVPGTAGRPTGNLAALTLLTRHTDGRRKMGIQVVIVVSGIVALFTWIMAMVVLGTATSDHRFSIDRIGFMYPQATTPDPNGSGSRNFWRQANALYDGARAVDFNVAWAALTVPPALMAAIYGVIALTSGNISDAHWWAKLHGFDLLETLWAIFADGPLLAFALLVLGERRYEVIMLVWFVAALSGGVPQVLNMLAVQFKNYRKQSKNPAESPSNTQAQPQQGSPSGPSASVFYLAGWTTTVVLGAAQVFVWVIFYNLAATNGRMLSSDNAGAQFLDAIYFMYATWWVVQRVLRFGFQSFTSDDEKEEAKVIAKQNRSLGLHIANTLIYSVVACGTSIAFFIVTRSAGLSTVPTFA